ncbi:non-ribosomal peptide synthetase [Nocardia fusca]|uniref:non-ribosomal peptide synthetase n=1 Tax=Nocardia fusca TaxID=941183 RepID=UPI0007A73B1D|nr:non-ribosomal peptide synthetase [Nocardia fusca]
MSHHSQASPPEIEDVLALSPLQEGFFTLARLAGDGDLYSMQFVLEITGPLDSERLRRSARAILTRHANLRVAFWDRDLPKPVQIVPTAAELPWSMREITADELDEVFGAQARAPFELDRGPLLRVLLARLPDETCRLILTAHHIVLDGWSLGVFFHELFALYDAGADASALPAPRPYRDYIGWLAARDSAADLRQWVRYLDRVEPLLVAEPGDSAVNTVVPTEHLQSLGRAGTERLVAWARTHGLTMNTVVQYAWALVLGRLTDRRDIVFGTTVSGRPDELPGVETMIGLFINTVPVRIRLDETSGVDGLLRWQRELAAMRDAGYTSLSSIQRTLGAGTLFDTLSVFENAPMNDVLRTTTAADGVQFRPVVSQSLTHYPLAVTSFLHDGELVVGIEAVQSALGALSGPDVGSRLLRVLRQLPESDTWTPDTVDVLLPGEYPGAPGLPAADVRGTTVAELFARQAAATPDAVAVTTEHERRTYRELSASVGRLAAVLASHGVGPEDVVALAVPRSVDTIVAVLAVLWTGAAYVPLDTTLPAARIESIVRRARPRLVVTDIPQVSGLDDVAGLPARLALSDVRWGGPVAEPVVVAPDSRTYVIFTSGSTGEPKGVMGTHGALASYFGDHRARVYRPAVQRLGRPLRIAHAWSFGFDASWQPLIGLLDGHSIHVFDADEMRDAHRLVEGISRHGLDMIDTTPSMFAQLAAAGLVDRGRSDLTVLALGGEAIGPALWKQLCALATTAVHNCYGPTETTVEAVVAAVTDAESVPVIGHPVTGTTAYVLDSRLRQVPAGVVGELYLSGAQVARGYADEPGRTAERFVSDPFRAGARMYRTGDLVRYLASGALSYLGRADDQVKIRGFRIEIGDIEAALSGLPGVRAAAVIALARPGGASLIGFAVGEGLSPARLRAALAERLPSYMLPQRVFVLDRLPTTVNGKLDTTSLAATARTGLDRAADTSPPSTPTERRVCEIMAQLSGIAQPGVDDDLVQLGLDSIVAISLVNALRREGLPISPKTVLDSSTIRELAARIDTDADRVADSGDMLPEPPGPVGPVPVVSWMHEFGGYRRLTQNNLLQLPDDIDEQGLTAVLQAVLDGHDMLRSQFTAQGRDYDFRTREPGSVRATDILTRVEVGADIGPVLAECARTAIDRIDPTTGDMVRAVWFVRADAPDVLLLSIHHLAVDVVSWHVLAADLAACWAQYTVDRAVTPPVETTPYRKWARLLQERAHGDAVSAQRDYWMEQVTAPDPALGARRPDPRIDTWGSCRVRPVPFTEAATGVILEGTVGMSAGVREFLLATLTSTLASWRAERGEDPATGAFIDMEGHGREDEVLGAEVDTARTVGWFTSVVPVRLGVGDEAVEIAAIAEDPARGRGLLAHVTDYLAAVPNSGVDYGLLRYLRAESALVAAPEPQILFEYLGRFDLAGAGGPWSLMPDTDLSGRLPLVPEPDFPLRYALDVISAVRTTDAGPQLVTFLRWSAAVFTESEIDRLVELWFAAARALERALVPAAARTS